MTAPLSKQNSTPQPVGQMALHTLLGKSLPLPAVRSYLVSGARRTYAAASHTEEYYPNRYQVENSVLGHLRFALRYEPCDLGILNAALLELGPQALTRWVQTEPTGAYSRRAWFFYETFTSDRLPVQDTTGGNYVDALPPNLYFTRLGDNSPRHRVRDNLLGPRNLCPFVRRTAKLEAFIAAKWIFQVQKLTEKYPADILARAVNYLYTKETRSSFALEGEVPSQTREQRFVQALRSLTEFNPSDKAALLRLQNAIVDPRYAAHDWRTIQNFVGQTKPNGDEHVHFICPKPDDVPQLMEGWSALTRRMKHFDIDPVVAAAVSAFAFVFIHPFEDGNGRIHRYLMHYLFEKRHLTSPTIIFPISAAILREKHLYDAALEAFSRPALQATEWEFTQSREIVVKNETRDLYRFFDATLQAEYLYDRVVATIQEDLIEELNFLVEWDAAFRAVRDIVDMPDRRAALLLHLMLQNGGRLSKNEREQFGELTDAEIEQMEAQVARALEVARPSETY